MGRNNGDVGNNRRKTGRYKIKNQIINSISNFRWFSTSNRRFLAEPVVQSMVSNVLKTGPVTEPAKLLVHGLTGPIG